MAALAAKRPRDPWGFMSRCFRDGKVLDEEASESDFTQPFTVYFEPKLAEALRDVVARCLRLRPESPLGWIGRELGQGRVASPALRRLPPHSDSEKLRRCWPRSTPNHCPCHRPGSHSPQ